MKITKTKLREAVDQKILSQDQADTLYHFLETDPAGGPPFDLTHLLYYLGGLLAIGAMTLFMNLGWESFGGPGIVVISLLYATAGLKLTQRFAEKGFAIPAGICATFVICLTPLAIYGLQQSLGVWPDESTYREYHRYIKWHWLYMELGTLAIGCILAWNFKYPFMMMPIAITLWYLSMDLTAMISGGDVSWELRKLVSLYVGLLMMGLAFWVDLRARNSADYAFWIYLFGALAFWGGLSLQHSDNEFSKFLYLCINLLMIAVGALLVRRIFVILGALGSCGYLGYLASDLFKDSWMFPISLTVIGLFIVYLGILWQKHEALITLKSRRVLPLALQELLANKR